MPLVVLIALLFLFSDIGLYGAHGKTDSADTTVPEVTSKMDGHQTDTRSPDSGAVVGETCKDEDGTPLEYFIVYKINNNYNYIVITRDLNGNQRARVAEEQVTSINSVLGQTLALIYRDSTGTISYLMWNDNPNQQLNVSQGDDGDCDNETTNSSEPRTEKWGHSKGVLAFSSTSGFLLLHSVPRFPPVKSQGYQYPSSGRTYAQSAFCISFVNINNHLALLEDVFVDMQTFVPQIYDSFVNDNVPENLKDEINILINPDDSCERPIEPTIGHSRVNSEIDIHSIGRSFENPAFDVDIFIDIAKFYEVSLITQTWYDRSSPIPPYCEGHTVEDIQDKVLVGNVVTRLQDHSKWGISKPRNSDVTCIGDLNRASTTMRRGGMFICIKNAYVHGVFNSFSPTLAEERC